MEYRQTVFIHLLTGIWGILVIYGLVAEGANVLISGRNESVLRDSAKEIGCQYLTLDVNDTNSFPSFISRAGAYQLRVGAYLLRVTAYLVRAGAYLLRVH